MKKRVILSLILTISMVASMLPSFSITAAAADYPYYVITSGATTASSSYYVYKWESGATAYSSCDTYTSITDATSAITAEVGSNSVTISFGLTGTGTSDLSGTLDAGTSDIILGSSGTYTIKGSLTSSASDVFYTTGAAIVIDGAAISNTGGDYGIYIFGGAGDVTVKSGSISATASGGTAIAASGSTGCIYVQGGTLTCAQSAIIVNTEISGTDIINISGGILSGASYAAVANFGVGNITMSGGSISCTEASGIGNYSTGEVIISGGSVSSETSPAIYNDSTGKISISGTADIFADYVYDTIYLNDGTAGTTILEITGGTVRNTCTLPLGTDDCNGPDFAIAVGNDGAGTVVISSGTLQGGTNGHGIYNYKTGAIKVSGGTITGGTNGYGAYNNSTGYIYLSNSSAKITGGLGGIYETKESTIIANDGEATATDYSGSAISLCFGDTITSGTTVAVAGVKSGTNDTLFSITNSGYTLKLSGTDLVINTYTESGNTASGIGSIDVSDSPKTITVTDVTSKVFADANQSLFSAKANMQNAFSKSVEARITDNTDEAAEIKALVADSGEVYPFDISLYIKGTETKTEPAEGYSVTITAPLPESLWDVRDSIKLVRATDGVLTTIPTTLLQKQGVWCIEFETNHFSPYALVVGLSTQTQSSTQNGLPYYLNDSGEKAFIGFAVKSDGETKYIETTGKTVSFADNTKNYSDVASSWAKDSIGFVTEREIFVGTDTNIFSPDGNMTRAMFAAVIGRLYERSYGSISAQSEHAFTDVDYNSAYGSYIDWAAKNGIIFGVGNGSYEPYRAISREEMAAVLYRFAKFLGVGPTGAWAVQLTYSDASDISGWATEGAMYCMLNGIITGRENSAFDPQSAATRAETAAILEKFIETVVES